MKKPFAITLDAGSSRRNLTGSWRVERPVYVDRLPPCNDACPAGENIQAWLYRAEEGDYAGAWRVLVEENPFPAIMGRVCYRPCESACNRGRLDESVGINAVERFVGDYAVREGLRLPEPGPDSGKRVLIVGAGPCGLSAAYHLRRSGHEVTMADAATRAGGMMRYGIPPYRLPRAVLDAEIGRLMDLGVDLRLDTRVDDVEAARSDGGFDAVLVAVGAQLPRKAEIPAGDSARILDALSLLRGDPDVRIGRRVAVYGGGDTALDAARTARRLGATDAVVVYRRTRDRMPAHDEEVEQAEEEGIRMRWLSTVKRVDGGHIVLERMELDETGFPQPTGQMDTLEADSLILALGEDSDLSLLEDVRGLKVERGLVVVDDGLMTGREGIFAGGDAVPGERSVTTAVGHGKRAARRIDAWLKGEARQPSRPRHDPATFERLNLWYYSDAPRAVRPQLDAARRRSTFDEVIGGLDEQNALFEARRCLSCGNCLECDNCYGVCPDNAVVKLGPGRRYAFDYDYCKGCGICVTECPCGAIEMIPETI